MSSCSMEGGWYWSGRLATGSCAARTSQVHSCQARAGKRVWRAGQACRAPRAHEVNQLAVSSHARFQKPAAQPRHYALHKGHKGHTRLTGTLTGQADVALPCQRFGHGRRCQCQKLSETKVPQGSDQLAADKLDQPGLCGPVGAAPVRIFSAHRSFPRPPQPRHRGVKRRGSVCVLPARAAQGEFGTTGLWGLPLRRP